MRRSLGFRLFFVITKNCVTSHVTDHGHMVGRRSRSHAKTAQIAMPEEKKNYAKTAEKRYFGQLLAESLLKCTTNVISVYFVRLIPNLV